MLRFSLAKKLLIWGGMLVAIPLLTTGMISNYKVTTTLTATAQREALQKAKELTSTIQLILKKEIDVATGLSSLDLVRKTALKVHQSGAANAKDDIHALNGELF